MEANTQTDLSVNSKLFNPYKNANPTELIEIIKTYSPINIWDILKKIKINRNTLYFMLRDFEFAGLIKTRMKINEHNRKIRLIYYNQKTKEEAESNILTPALNSENKLGDENGK